MKGKLDYIHRRGLPGGPNEQFTYVTGVFSMDGYRNDSPDVNNPFNVIPSGRITMKEKDGQPLKKGPILGIDNLGNQQMMMPGREYQFPGNQVFELPLKKEGGALLDKTIKCSGCGWEWKAVDGGSDIMDCHKCGGEGLVKAQDGAEVDEEDNDREMVEGIADILRQVKSVKNRKQIADNMVEDFEEEDVDYNLQEFLKMSRVMKEGGDLRKAQMGYMIPPIGISMMTGASRLYDYFFGEDPKSANSNTTSKSVGEVDPYKKLSTAYAKEQQAFQQQRKANDLIPTSNSANAISLSSGRFQGASVSPQVVNEAVSAAKAQGIDPWLMLSVIGRESTFGSGAASNLKRAGDKSRLVSGWDVAENYQPYEPLRYLADKKVPGIEVTKDNHGWHYDIEDRQALNNYIKQHPELVEQYREKIEATPELGKLDSFDLAAKFLKEKGLARYNPGDPDYSSMVRQDMQTLKSDPKLRSYMRTLGYEEGGELDEYQKGGPLQKGIEKGSIYARGYYTDPLTGSYVPSANIGFQTATMGRKRNTGWSIGAQVGLPYKKFDPSIPIEGIGDENFMPDIYGKLPITAGLNATYLGDVGNFGNIGKARIDLKTDYNPHSGLGISAIAGPQFYLGSKQFRLGELRPGNAYATITPFGGVAANTRPNENGVMKNTSGITYGIKAEGEWKPEIFRKVPLSIYAKGMVSASPGFGKNDEVIDDINIFDPETGGVQTVQGDATNSLSARFGVSGEAGVRIPIQKLAQINLPRIPIPERSPFKSQSASRELDPDITIDGEIPEMSGTGFDVDLGRRVNASTLEGEEIYVKGERKPNLKTIEVQIPQKADGGELEQYKKYINGEYENTPEELEAKKIYDKLNRVYYKAAKDAGMSAPNYIMSTLLTL
jgi:hypothetical protein